MVLTTSSLQGERGSEEKLSLSLLLSQLFAQGEGLCSALSAAVLTGFLCSALSTAVLTEFMCSALSAAVLTGFLCSTLPIAVLTGFLCSAMCPIF
ncbi:unnamed protein product [Prunus armeniaca]